MGARSGNLFIHQKLSTLGRQIIRALRGTPGKIRARKSYFSQIQPLPSKYQILFCGDIEINIMDHRENHGHKKDFADIKQVSIYCKRKYKKLYKTWYQAGRIYNYYHIILWNERAARHDWIIQASPENIYYRVRFAHWQMLIQILVLTLGVAHIFQEGGEFFDIVWYMHRWERPWLYNPIWAGNDVTIRAALTQSRYWCHYHPR